MSQQNTHNRLILLTIAGLPLTMVLAATWLWYFVARGELDVVGALGTANRGTLVDPPRQLADAPLRRGDGSAFDFGALEPKWRLLIPRQGERCGDDCEHLLYLTRQIHLAIGKEFNRIERFHVADSAPAKTGLAVNALSDNRELPATFSDYLEREHPGLLALQLPSAELRALFPEHIAATDTWYLVDPAGWIMMSYDDSVSYKDVIADLKFLLKNSSE